MQTLTTALSTVSDMADSASASTSAFMEANIPPKYTTIIESLERDEVSAIVVTIAPVLSIVYFVLIFLFQQCGLGKEKKGVTIAPEAPPAAAPPKKVAAPPVKAPSPPAKPAAAPAPVKRAQTAPAVKSPAGPPSKAKPGAKPSPAAKKSGKGGLSA